MRFVSFNNLKLSFQLINFMKSALKARNDIQVEFKYTDPFFYKNKRIVQNIDI